MNRLTQLIIELSMQLIKKADFFCFRVLGFMSQVLHRKYATGFGSKSSQCTFLSCKNKFSMPKINQQVNDPLRYSCKKLPKEKSIPLNNAAHNTA